MQEGAAQRMVGGDSLCLKPTGYSTVPPQREDCRGWSERMRVGAIRYPRFLTTQAAARER